MHCVSFSGHFALYRPADCKQVSALSGAISMLHVRVRLIVEYAVAVRDGK